MVSIENIGLIICLSSLSLSLHPSFSIFLLHTLFSRSGISQTLSLLKDDPDRLSKKKEIEKKTFKIVMGVIENLEIK